MKLFSRASSSLKIKLPLSIVVIVAITFTISTALALYSFTYVTDTVKSSHLQAAAKEVGESINTKILQASRDMVMTASIPDVLKAVDIPPEHLATPEDTKLRANLKNLFERILLAYGYYNSLYIVNDLGQFIVGTKFITTDLTKGMGGELFSEAMRKHGFSLGKTIYSPSMNRLAIPIFLEVVYNGYGGALVSSLNIRKIVDNAVQHASHQEMGYLVFSFNKSSFLEISRDKGVTMPLELLAEQLRGKATGFIDVSVKGKDYSLGFYHVPQTDIYAVAVADDDYMHGPTMILRNTALWSSAIALFIIMFCVYYFINPVTRDILHLSRFAKSVTEGKDDIIVNNNRKDELGDLANSLSKMVDTLKEMVLRSESATKAKSDFLARMSHEIRTPMNGILGMTYLAMQAEPEEKHMDYLRRIDTAARTLLDVINDILDFSKIEAEKMDINNVTFRLSGVLASMHDMLDARAKEKGLKLELTMADDVPDIIFSDPLRFAQICINLCSNGIKFTTEGYVHLHISLSEKHNENIILLVTVKDSGIGMSYDGQQNIFESFAQADGTTTRKYGGTGLGLSISKSLVHLLGGEIWVESELGEGSTFAFTMKTVEGFESDLEEVETKKTTEYSVPSLKVLLAEDNDINQLIATEILAGMGVHVTIANNGLEAISNFESGEFDLILMDIQMPTMDGLTAAMKIRQSAHPKAKAIPIIAMTAHAMTGDREKSIQYGMNDHITKPINIDELYNVLVFWGTTSRSENKLV